MTDKSKPLAVSLGESAGVGPELVAALWRQRREAAVEPFLAVGPMAALGPYLDGQEMRAVEGPEQVAAEFPHRLPVLNINLAAPVRVGRPDPANSPAVIEAVRIAASLARAGAAKGLVTGPIHKAALFKTGFAFAGHTDFLADLAGLDPSQVVMMFVSDEMRVAALTHHMPLRKVPAAVTKTLLETALNVMARALRDDFGLAAPLIAVAGLNPHAGEDGEFGREEIEIIGPAIKKMRREGLKIEGPWPADSLFRPEIRKRYDAILAMYHDQALTPVKALGFGRAVNLTLGLPYIRTSPDHGTALDIAGRGKADVSGMLAAVRLADKLGSRRARRSDRAA